jgi:DNA mismatch endonuclease (patch repair protein)
VTGEKRKSEHHVMTLDFVASYKRQACECHANEITEAHLLQIIQQNFLNVGKSSKPTLPPTAATEYAGMALEGLMTDVFSQARRSEIMGRVPSKNTRPEITVRKMLHEAGYRYRLHSEDLPGCPDVVFPARKKVLFVHGCFWHRHVCASATLPKSNRDYWEEKQSRNAARDKRAIRALRKSGWKVMVIWECEIKDAKTLLRRLSRFLKDT